MSAKDFERIITKLERDKSKLEERITFLLEDLNRTRKINEFFYRAKKPRDINEDSAGEHNDRSKR